MNVDDQEGNEDLRAADVLRWYLRNKSVLISWNVDPNQPSMCHPGHITVVNLKEKLSRQLKIDLEEHEKIHIRDEPVPGLEEKSEVELMELLMEMDSPLPPAAGRRKVAGRDEGEDLDNNVDDDDDAERVTETTAVVVEVATSEGGDSVKEDTTRLKQLGDYVAKITLRGGYIVPLKFSIVRR